VGGDHRRLYHQLDVPVRAGAKPAGAGAGEKHRRDQHLLGTWFIAFLPLGILLILTMPLLAYWFYPPEVKVNDEVPLWAAVSWKNWANCRAMKSCCWCSSASRC
jgi:hypothetical protein